MSKKNESLPREEYIEFFVDARNSGEFELTFDNDLDISNVKNLIQGTAKHVRSYHGKNKKRPLAIMSGGEKLSFSQEEFIFENYDKIFFIDTNDDSFKGKKSCCTAIYEVNEFKEILKNPAIDKVCLKFLRAFYLLDVKDHIPGEKIGWHLFLEGFKTKFHGAKTLLITDHALSEHDDMNNRKKPYYLDFYLPENLKLGYAKSDKATSFVEKVMRDVDKSSNKIKVDFKQKNENKSFVIRTLNYDNNFRGFVEII